MMKSIAIIAAGLTVLLGLAWGLTASEQNSAAPSNCRCVGCACPDCNGEFCTCVDCKCLECGCAKLDAQGNAACPAGAGACCAAKRALPAEHCSCQCEGCDCPDCSSELCTCIDCECKVCRCGK